jgi:hypothetical protein
VENEDEEDQIDEENEDTPFSAHLAKNLVSKDPSLDFMDPASANVVKNYIDLDELISPQMKQIIDNQKKLMPKNFQNCSYRRRNSCSYSGSNYSTQMASQIAAQMAKTLVTPSNSFFQEGEGILGECYPQKLWWWMARVETESIRHCPGGTEGKGRGCSQRGPIKNVFAVVECSRSRLFGKKRSNADLHE